MGQFYGFTGREYDAESGLYYYRARYYDPQVGRFISRDPIGVVGGWNRYGYGYNNPLHWRDPYGLFGITDLPVLPQPVVDASAGFGDTLLLGFGDELRTLIGMGGVNLCSKAYSIGEYGGIVAGFLAGGVAGWRAAGQKAAGREFSHWIPRRMGGPRSKWNGNYVTPNRHYKHDPYRYPPRSQRSGDKWPRPMQQLDRIPNVYKGSLIGGSVTGAGAASSGCGC